MTVIVTGTHTVPLKLTQSGQNPVTVVSTALISTSGAYAIGGSSLLPWSVTNRGTIKDTGSSGVGVSLAGGGVVVNGSANVTGALISGPTQGVYITGGASTIINYGTITATANVSTGAQVGAGLIVNGSNTDTVASISGHEQDVVTGYHGTGIGTVINYGTIANAVFHAVWLASGGTLVNGSATATKALISGASSGEGVRISGGAGTVTNFGTIAAGTSGVYLASGGTVINGSASVTGALISGGAAGVLIAGAVGTVMNYGTITANTNFANNYGVSLSAGGTVINGSANDTSAFIIGTSGAWIKGASGAVINYGTIAAAVFTGVELFSGGEVINGSTSDTSSLIKGGYHGDGVGTGGIGTIANYGTITSIGRYKGVTLGYHSIYGGVVTNGSVSDTKATIEAYAQE